MSKLFVVVLLLTLVSTTFAAEMHSTFTAQGTGGISVSKDSTWDSGVDNTSLGGSSGNSMLTAIGDFKYQTKDNFDALTRNFYNQTGYARFDNGGVFTDSINMESSDPYQSVLVEHYGILQAAEMDSAKYVDGADLSSGQQVAWDGAGVYSRDVDYKVEQQRETDGKVYHFRTDSNSHETVFTNMSGGAIVRPEFEFLDFSDSFITNDTALGINETTNQTVDIAPATMGAL